MRNQPFSSITADGSGEIGSIENPRRRPWILSGMIVAVFVLIGLRVVYVQVHLAERYRASWREVLFDEVPIPSRDGRIVSSDGVVLAVDERRYDIAVDYRWLQTPPDPRWLRQQVSARLDRSERRDAAKRAEIEQALLHQREELRRNLAHVARVDEKLVTDNMAAIQRRIENMLRAVEGRRAQRAEENSDSSRDWTEGLTGIWQVIAEELTTPPNRFENDPLILKEELQDHVVLQNVPLDVVAAIHSQPARFPGVHVRSTSTRSYPQHDLAPHVIGLRKEAGGATGTDDETKRTTQGGIEEAFNQQLSGMPGLMRIQRNQLGEETSREEVRPPKDGEDVVLTLDSRLQEIAESLLDAALDPSSQVNRDAEFIPQGGTLIAMDLWTGNVLAMASGPRPSLSVLMKPTQEEWDRYQQDSRHPLFPRTNRMAIAPGPLFTILTTIAALEEGALDPAEPYECRGFLDQPDRDRCLLFRRFGMGHGALSPDEALSRGCQVYYYEMARRIGPGPILEWASRFGLGHKTGVALPSEHAGNLPDLSDGRIASNQSATFQIALGQGQLLVTPLQMVRMTAAIANGGYLVTPRLVQGEEDTATGSQQVPGLSPETLKIIQAGLQRSIHDDEGVSQSARIDLLTYAGLSGVAEVANKPGHVWFAGYAPAHRPRVAVVVVLEHAGTAAAVGSVVKEFVTELLGFGFLQPYSPDVP